jgi:sulfite reductase (NADPH) hemoprotein beta-component
VYQEQRTTGETFISTLRRVGFDTFKTAANGARHPAPALA